MSETTVKEPEPELIKDPNLPDGKWNSLTLSAISFIFTMVAYFFKISFMVTIIQIFVVIIAMIALVTVCMHRAGKVVDVKITTRIPQWLMIVDGIVYSVVLWYCISPPYLWIVYFLSKMVVSINHVSSTEKHDRKYTRKYAEMVKAFEPIIKLFDKFKR